jgi:hypothetical protein
MVRAKPLRLLWVTLLLSASLLALTKHTFRDVPRGYEPLLSDPTRLYGEPCSPFAAGVMQNVTIVLKMGAGEVSTRLPAYLDRFGQCQQDILLFSDRESKHGHLPIHDALANLHPEYRSHNPDFDVYNAIQHLHDSSEKTREGWRLDKYKFLPMMEHTWYLRPHSHWFVFIELDTYVNWDNMHRFLRTFDHEQPHYFGSPVWPRHKPVFAHGGTGYVLSKAALKRLVLHGRKFAKGDDLPGTHMFGKNMQKECCGDEVLASVLKASGTKLRGYWPMFNGEKPATVRFGREQWCEAILTLHHLSTDDFTELDLWESSSWRRRSAPLTFEELFSYIEPSLRERRDDWTNMSDDVDLHGGDAGISFDTCLAACQNDQACLQFEHVRSTCRLSYDIRLGHHRRSEGGKTWTSGWMMDRIQAFKASHSPCDTAHFVHPNP